MKIFSTFSIAKFSKLILVCGCSTTVNKNGQKHPYKHHSLLALFENYSCLVHLLFQLPCEENLKHDFMTTDACASIFLTPLEACRFD